MSKSSEQYFLGGLLNDIDKDINPDKFEKNISKDETTYKTSKEQFFSSNNSNFSQAFPTAFFSPSNPSFKTSSIQNPQNPINYGKINFINNFMIIFKNQRMTKEYQKKLEGASMETIDNIVNELSGSYRLAIKNKNGNYFCSDLIKRCNKEQRLLILKELSNTISEDSIDEFGSHVIQKLIEFASGEEEYNLLLFSFNDSNSILTTSMNPNGTYVIQKIIVHIPEKFRMKFNIIFVNFVLTLSKDVYGVFTVKKFIGYTQNELIRKQLLNSIFNNILNISSNQYGNYLIQYLLEKWWKSTEGVYLKKLIFSKFLVLASNYYSSFICDLFYKLCNDEEKKSLATFIKTNNKMLDNLYKNNDIKNNRIPSCLYTIASNDNNQANNQK
jgi:hypothetical protein